MLQKNVNGNRRSVREQEKKMLPKEVFVKTTMGLNTSFLMEWKFAKGMQRERKRGKEGREKKWEPPNTPVAVLYLFHFIYWFFHATTMLQKTVNGNRTSVREQEKIDAAEGSVRKNHNGMKCKFFKGMQVF